MGVRNPPLEFFNYTTRFDFSRSDFFVYVFVNVPSKLCVCAHTQAMRRAHTRKLGAHIYVPFKNVYAVYVHISYYYYYY